MMGEMKWYGDPALERMKAAARKGVLLAGNKMLELTRVSLKALTSKGADQTPSPPGHPPATYIGKLADSITVGKDQLNDPKWPKVQVGTNLAYARIQEFGGIVLPKRVRKLPVPIGAEGREFQRKLEGRSLRSAGLVPIFGKGGKVIGLAQRQVKRQKRAPKGEGWTNRGAMFGVKTYERLVPLFRLVDSVYLPPRPYLRPTFHRNAKRFQQIIAAEIAKVKGVTPSWQ